MIDNTTDNHLFLIRIDERDLQLYKAALLPPYRKTDAPVIGATLVLLIGLIFTVSTLNNSTNTQSRAASVNSVEPEDGALAGNVTVVDDPNASGGKYVRFGVVSSPTPIPAGFPSRLKAVTGRLIDENGADIGILKGMNVHVAPTTSSPTFVWPQSDYTAMGQVGMRFVRHVIHWDVFEPTEDALNQTAIASLDTAISRAKTAGMYTLLEVHLNVGRVPAWAQDTSSEWSDFVANGRTITQYLAARYKDEKAVIGFNPNEPPTVSLTAIMDGYDQIVPWWQQIAPAWPVWVSPSAYGNGTPTPRSGTPASISRYQALNNGRGIIIEFHDYLNQGSDSYQANGSINPIQQGGTAEFHGWGGNYPYRDTIQSRSDIALHLQPQTAFTTAGGFALAIAEFGMDNRSGELAYVRDKIAAFRQARSVVECWWNYDTNVSNPWAPRPGGIWRQAILDWMAMP